MVLYKVLRAVNNKPMFIVFMLICIHILKCTAYKESVFLVEREEDYDSDEDALRTDEKQGDTVCGRLNKAANIIEKFFTSSWEKSAILVVSAYPSEESKVREKRDVMESMKNAWNEVVKTLSDAGDAVVHVFKPTEKSVIDKMADGIKNIGQ